jgi:hypothetical protein
MPHAVTQTPRSMPILQHAHANAGTQTEPLPDTPGFRVAMEDRQPQGLLPVGLVLHALPADEQTSADEQPSEFEKLPTECCPWNRMALGLLIELDCENTMKAVREGWTIEQGNQRSLEVNACFTYNVYLITSDWNTKAALWRRCGRITRDLILLRARASTGTNDWPSLMGRLNEFVATLDTETADKFISQLCKAYDKLFPSMVAERRSAMNIKDKRQKKGQKGR